MHFDTFEDFMSWADSVVMKITQLGIEDFADAPWMDLYEELNGDLNEDDVIETLEEWDDIFAQMVAI